MQKKVTSCLQEKVRHLTETQALNVEPSLHDDLVTVMDEHENEVIKNCLSKCYFGNSRKKH